MLKKISYGISLILLLFSKPILAEAGWTSTTQILELTATSSGGKFIIHAIAKDNPTDCRDKEKFFLNYSYPGANQIYDLLLQAAVTKIPVKFYISGRCELFGMSEISRVSLIIEASP